MSLASDIRMEMLGIEGKLFIMRKTLDQSTNLNEFCRLKKEIEQSEIRHTQFRLILEEDEKQEALKRIKRKMNR